MSSKKATGYRESSAPSCAPCRWLYGGPPMFDGYSCAHPRGGFDVDVAAQRPTTCPLQPRSAR